MQTLLQRDLLIRLGTIICASMKQFSKFFSKLYAKNKLETTLQRYNKYNELYCQDI